MNESSPLRLGLSRGSYSDGRRCCRFCLEQLLELFARRQPRGASATAEENRWRRLNVQTLTERGQCLDGIICAITSRRRLVLAHPVRPGLLPIRGAPDLARA